MSYENKDVVLPIAGLDTDKPAEYITDANSPNVMNIDIDHSVIRKRNGSSILGVTISGTNPDILGARQFTVNSVDYFTRIGANAAEEWDGSTWNGISPAALTASSADEISTCSPTLSGSRILVFTNGIDAVQKYTGAGNHAALGGTPPKAKYCEDFGPYTLLAHITDDSGSAYRTRIEWCDTGDPENWSTGVSGYKDLYGAYDITGIKKYGSVVTVHSQDAIYVGYLVSTDSIFGFNAVYTPGSLCNATIGMLPNGLLAYLAIDGLRLFNGSTSELVTSKINDDLKQQMNFDYIYRSWGILVQELNEYWFGVPIGSNEYVRDVYRLNYITGNLYKNNFGVNIRSVATFSNTDDISWNEDLPTWDSATDRWDNTTNSAAFPVVSLHTDTGDTYYLSSAVNSDNGTAIESVYESKDYIIGKSGQLGRWLSMELWAKGTKLDIYYSIDEGETWYLIKEVTLSSSYPTDDSPSLLFWDVVSSKIRFKFENNETTGTFYLKQFNINASPREMRGA